MASQLTNGLITQPMQKIASNYTHANERITVENIQQRKINLI